MHWPGLESLKLATVFTLLTCLEDAPGSSCLLFLTLASSVALTTSSVIVEPGVSHKPLQYYLVSVTYTADLSLVDQVRGKSERNIRVVQSMNTYPKRNGVPSVLEKLS